MSNLTVTNRIQTSPIQTATKPQAKAAAQSAAQPITMADADQLSLSKMQRDHKIKNAVVGISTIGGLAGGAGMMLMSKSTTGMMIGMGIMGAGLLSGRIAEGKNIGEGAVAFLGAGASIGIGAAVGKLSGQPLVGGVVAGACILGTLALSRSLKQD